MLKIKILTQSRNDRVGYRIKLYTDFSEREYKEFLKFLAKTKLGEPK